MPQFPAPTTISPTEDSPIRLRQRKVFCQISTVGLKFFQVNWVRAQVAIAVLKLHHRHAGIYIYSSTRIFANSSWTSTCRFGQRLEALHPVCRIAYARFSDDTDAEPPGGTTVERLSKASRLVITGTMVSTCGQLRVTAWCLSHTGWIPTSRAPLTSMR